MMIRSTTSATRLVNRYHSIADNEVVPVDTVGEICVRGYCNMIGCHANESATNETIDEEGWLHTGDLGTMDTRGYVRMDTKSEFEEAVRERSCVGGEPGSGRNDYGTIARRYGVSFTSSARVAEASREAPRQRSNRVIENPID